MSNLFESHIVGFLITRLSFLERFYTKCTFNVKAFLLSCDLSILKGYFLLTSLTDMVRYVKFVICSLRKSVNRDADN